MTNIKNKFLTVFLIISVIITAVSLILFSQEITAGIIDSINRCLTVIIPSLFCFLVLSSFLIYTNLYIIISKPFDIISRYVFRIKTEHFSIFLLSLFAGYPAGAKLLSELKEKNMIEKKDAEIAELRGIKQTRVVTELLEECKPQFIAIRDALIAVKNNEPNPQAILNKMFANSFKNLGDVFEDLSND